jgi:hypothetical protein
MVNHETEIVTLRAFAKKIEEQQVGWGIFPSDLHQALALGYLALQ